MTAELMSVLIALIGCFVGLAGWLSGRDKRIANDGEWRGRINEKLDTIISITSKVEKLEIRVNEHGERLAIVEDKAASAHHRIDDYLKCVK